MIGVPLFQPHYRARTRATSLHDPTRRLLESGQCVWTYRRGLCDA